MEGPETTEQSAEALGITEVLRECLVYGVLTVDANRRICAFNEEAEKLTGLKAATLLGASNEALPKPLQDTLVDCLARKSGFGLRPIVFFDDAGIEHQLHVTGVVCLRESSEVAGATLILTDLSAVHKLGWSLQQFDRLASLGMLSASMAHEIKNAFVAINTFVEDLLERNKEVEIAGVVRRELRRIDNILSQMLKVGRPAKPTFSRVSVHRVLDQSLRLIQPQLNGKQIRLRRSFSAPADLVEGNDYQLEQVFVNLLLNAIAATDANGTLTLTTDRLPPSASSVTGDAGQPQIEIAISDTGVGIAPENLARLFEPFYTTKPQGTGLGLAISRRIVMDHRGKITAESELNKGTTFRITLPAVSTGR